jgi:large subunit ribosomal protein L6
MSRVGKLPIVLPQGVDVTAGAETISVKGSLGTLVRPISPLVSVKKEDDKLTFVAANDSQDANAMSGTMRALVANMVAGVTKGFEKKLSLVGVGFRAQAAGSKLNLQIGFSHPVSKDMPAGVKVETPSQTEIVIKGFDRQAVGQVAAEVRALRPPEPYKGKGIKYAGEIIRRKAGKAGGK